MLYSNQKWGIQIMFSNDKLNDEFNEMYGKESESENKIAKAIKLTDNISSIDIKKAILKNENASLQSVIESMQLSHSSCILIINNNKIIGIFTERDVITKVVGKDVNLGNEEICNYMTNKPEILYSDDSIAFALNKMIDGGFRHIPIVHTKSKEIFVISMQDIINSIGDFYFDDIVNLPPKPLRSTSQREGA